jgi:1,4-dihydroxy-6-naphthoate synthase
MVHNLVDTEGISFNVQLADVEELNSMAAKEDCHVCKLSYHAFFYLCKKYVMLNSGSALGYNNGPLLVTSKENLELSENVTVAVPGMMTTGALLLKIAYPFLKNISPVLFSEIAQKVKSGEFDAGVLIHEGRFTYKQAGLKLIQDLGLFWQKSSGLPVPLGGIAISRGLDNEIHQKVNRILKKSIEFAFEYPCFSDEYVNSNAQIEDRDIQRKHIELFVNQHTLELGEEGKNAVYSLYLRAMHDREKLMDRDNLFIL